MNHKDLHSIFEKSPSWPEVSSILEHIYKSQHESLIVGGAVRDALLGKTPKDFDIASSATPDELVRIFPNAKQVGRSFGVIWLPLKKSRSGIEIATFRTEGGYQDGRRPDEVHFCKSAEEDCKRRDFTMNALYYNPHNKEILDFMKGQQDLEKKLIQTVGLAKDRFGEDKLRLLRALRFIITLSPYKFSFSEETAQSIKEQMPDIKQLASERVIDEVAKIFQQECWADTFMYFDQFKVLENLFPHWTELKNTWKWWTDKAQHNNYNKTFLNNLNKNLKKEQRFQIGWILMFYPEAARVFAEEQDYSQFISKLKTSLKEIKAYTITINTVTQFYSLFFKLFDKKESVSNKASALGQSNIPINLLREVIERTGDGLEFSEKNRKPSIQYLSKNLGGIQVTDFFTKITSKPDPWITGKDLQDIGMTPDLKFKYILNEMYAGQLTEKYKDKKEALVDLKNVIQRFDKF